MKRFFLIPLLLLFLAVEINAQQIDSVSNLHELLSADSILLADSVIIEAVKLSSPRGYLTIPNPPGLLVEKEIGWTVPTVCKKVQERRLTKENALRIDHDSLLNDRKLNLAKFEANNLNKIDSISRKANSNLSSRKQKFRNSIAKRTNGIIAGQGKLDKKLGKFDKNGEDIGQLNLSGLTEELPEVVNLSGMDAKQLSSIPNLDLPDAIGSFPTISNIDVGLDKISAPKLDKLSELTGKTESLDKISGDVTEHMGKVSDLTAPDLAKARDLPTTLESQLAKVDQMKAVSEQIESVPDYAEMTKKWNSDPEVMKEMVLSKAKETAVNHFAGHEEELKSVMEQLSKFKSKIPDPEGIVDLYSRHKNLVKGKPFVERLVPGFAMQFQKEHSVWLDLNPYVTFKISGRFATGIGWNERLAYDFKSREWDALNRIYGPRMSLLFKVKENLWVKGEIEGMRGTLTIAGGSGSDVASRHWIVTYFGGIKKDFQISKVLKGHIQMMYNVYDPDRDSPYTNKLNVRMGVDLPLKKRFRDSTIKSNGLGEI